VYRVENRNADEDRVSGRTVAETYDGETAGDGHEWIPIASRGDPVDAYRCPGGW
jgi:hypothetical protein